MFHFLASIACFILPLFCKEDVPGTSIKYSDCGPPGVIQSVNLSPCSSQPCTFKKGVNVTIQVNFTTAAEVSSIHANVYGIIEHIPIPYPLPKSDGCHQCNLACPLQPGRHSYINTLPVLKSYPAIKLPVKWALVDENKKAILCFIFPMAITE